MHQGHGDNSYQYLQKPIADFSTNVWYGGEPAGLKEHLSSQWPMINRYHHIGAIYRSSGYTVQELPNCPVEKRADLILKMLQL